MCNTVNGEGIFVYFVVAIFFMKCCCTLGVSRCWRIPFSWAKPWKWRAHTVCRTLCTQPLQKSITPAAIFPHLFLNSPPPCAITDGVIERPSVEMTIGGLFKWFLYGLWFLLEASGLDWTLFYVGGQQVDTKTQPKTATWSKLLTDSQSCCFWSKMLQIVMIWESRWHAAFRHKLKGQEQSDSPWIAQQPGILNSLQCSIFRRYPVAGSSFSSNTSLPICMTLRFISILCDQSGARSVPAYLFL